MTRTFGSPACAESQSVSARTSGLGYVTALTIAEHTMLFNAEHASKRSCGLQSTTIMQVHDALLLRGVLVGHHYADATRHGSPKTRADHHRWTGVRLGYADVRDGHSQRDAGLVL